MKIKLFTLLVMVFGMAIVASQVMAKPVSTEESQSAALLRAVSPALVKEADAQALPEVTTATSSIDLASLKKEGVRDYHFGVEAAKPKRGVYAETNPDSTEPAIYIVQLQDPPLATYRGGIANLPATSPKQTGQAKLDIQSSASVAYRSYLRSQQAIFEQAAAKMLGHSLKTIYHYEVTFNGLAVRLTPAEAAKLVSAPGVASVQRDQWRHVQTNDTPTYLGVTGIWDGTNTGGLGGTKGQGVIVGVIDSGIWPEHPSFADDGSFPAPPAKWHGECTPPADASAVYTCTNKLIGIQYFLDGYVAAVGGTYDGLFLSGRDDDGHGTHTASTAAGNQDVPASIYGISRGLVSGMAPHAHVAVYKGLGPSGGVTSDLVAAIDKAVADGVDVINYSVGSDFAGDPWVDADSLAYLSARDAGVFVATSAGNAGPGDSTIGSPANAPWVTSVGASYFNRLYLSNITLTVASSVVMTTYGSTTTPGVTNFRLRDAEGITDTVGDTSGQCLNPFPPGTFTASQAVLCPRGGIATWMKGNFVKDGGAGAIVIYNSDDNFDLMSYLHAIPAVYIYRKDGLAIKNLLLTSTVRITFTQGARVTNPPDPRIPIDTVVGFSSRGPDFNAASNELIDVIKPDVTAPGIHILAGASPDYITVDGGYSDKFGKQGELFQVIQGTSMSSPHVAGVAALLKALHPNWTPTEIQSALMTTALSQNQRERLDELTINPAEPFDLGAGRIDMTKAARAGFVLDETAANFLDVDPFFGGDPSTLNLPSLANSKCVVTCGWTRILNSAQGSSVNWTVSISKPATLTLNVSPASFNLGNGGTQAISVTANVGNQPLDQWIFAQINFTPNNPAIPVAHFPVAIQPTASSLPSLVEIQAITKTGVFPITNLRAINITALTIDRYGLTRANLTQISLSTDSDNSDPFDNLTDGVFYITRTVTANTKRFVSEITVSEAPDLDMYVGLDNGDGIPQPNELVCISASGTAFEYCDLPDPAPGVYWVLVQNWAGSASQPDDLILGTAVVPAANQGNMTVTGPNSVAGGALFNLQIGWNTSSMSLHDRWYGAFDVGADAGHHGNLGTIAVNLKGPDNIYYLPIIRKKY